MDKNILAERKIDIKRIGKLWKKQPNRPKVLIGFWRGQVMYTVDDSSTVFSFISEETLDVFMISHRKCKKMNNYYILDDDSAHVITCQKKEYTPLQRFVLKIIKDNK